METENEQLIRDFIENAASVIKEKMRQQERRKSRDQRVEEDEQQQEEDAGGQGQEPGECTV